MPKRGQHQESGLNPSQPRGHEKSRGRNKPSETQEITTGTYKKKETYAKQAHEHQDPHKQAQSSINPWNDEIRDHPTTDASTRARASDLSSGRSGTESNAS